MVITDYLERNARLYGSESALVEINPSEPRYLKVVWGQGYKIERNLIQVHVFAWRPRQVLRRLDPHARALFWWAWPPLRSRPMWSCGGIRVNIPTTM